MDQPAVSNSAELQDATVGIITALREEYAACRHVMDPVSQGREIERDQNTGRLTCWVCRVQAKKRIRSNPLQSW
jgi:hypothetical protein